MVKKTGSVRIM